MIRPNASTKRRQSSPAKKRTNSLSKADGQEGGGATSVADDRRSKTNQLFEELLGDDASAIGSLANDNKDQTKGGEESVMSSVLRPLQTKRVPQSQDNNGNNDIPQDRRNASLRAKHIPMQQQQQQQRQQMQVEEEEDGNDEATFMTKPREIVFDSNSDDVSALFGGIGGGASVIAEGMQSYRGTFAKNRRGGGGGGGGRGALSKQQQRRGMKFFNSDGNNNNKYEDESRRTGASTFQSHGVTSILEEIGLRPSSRAVDKSSTSDSDEEGKGHYNNKYRNRHRNSNDDGGGRHRGRGRKDSSSSSFKFNSTKTAIFCVVGMFIFVQFTTIRKQNKKTMTHLNERFDNRYTPLKEQAVSSHSGISNELRDLAMENVEGGNDRRRGAYMRPDQNNAAHDEQTWHNDAAKVPPVQDQKWDQLDQDQMFLDDGISDTNGGNLRGRNPQVVQTETSAMQPLFNPGDSDGEMQLQQQHEQPQQVVPAQQQTQQQIQPLKNQLMFETPNTNTDDMNMADTHPLLKPKEGLSMADAVEKLGAVDKLSDIDPRPKQQLSNELIPARFKVFADLRTPFVVGRDTPFYWHIPRSGGVVLKTLLSHCLGQTLSAEVGELNGHENDLEVKVISFAEHNYTNVNVATPEGIARALNRGLVPSHLSDTIVSAHVDLIPSLFNANDKAKAFVMFRHPVDRAASML